MAAGSAVAMIGANLRFGVGAAGNTSLNATRMFQCHPGGSAQAGVIFLLGSLGIGANMALMVVILSKKQLRRWSQGLLFHQALVDCARAALLLPLGISIFKCQPVNKCSLLETAFLLLVTVSTVNMLTTVLNDSPVFPEREEDHADLTGPLLMDSPQCVLFGTFIIWFASITINLGPTFLSGALAASADSGPRAPSCPLVHGPYRHYVLNVLWIAINLICVTLTLFHLRKLHRDLTKANVEAVRVAGLVTTLLGATGGQGANGAPRQSAVEEQRRMRSYLERVEREGVRKVRLFMVSTAAYVVCWGPLFLVTLALSTHTAHHRLAYEITLHVSHAHAAVSPLLFLCLHRALRRAAVQLCCGCCVTWSRWVLSLTAADDITAASPLGEPAYEPQQEGSPEPPPCPPPPPHSHTMLGDSTMMIERWTVGSVHSSGEDGENSRASSAQGVV